MRKLDRDTYALFSGIIRGAGIGLVLWACLGACYVALRLMLTGA